MAKESTTTEQAANEQKDYDEKMDSSDAKSTLPMDIHPHHVESSPGLTEEEDASPLAEPLPDYVDYDVKSHLEEIRQDLLDTIHTTTSHIDGVYASFLDKADRVARRIEEYHLHFMNEADTVSVVPAQFPDGTPIDVVTMVKSYVTYKTRRAVAEFKRDTTEIALMLATLDNLAAPS